MRGHDRQRRGSGPLVISNREKRLLEVERLAATGMTQKGIAGAVGVHPRTVADDIAILRWRTSHRKSETTTLKPLPVLAQENPQQSTPRQWTNPLPCDQAWALTPRKAGVNKWRPQMVQA